MRIAVLRASELASHRDALETLARTRSYPLDATTRFRIDHGTDYGRFARRLGAPRFVLALDDADRVLGLAAAVRRRRWWYLCDLKTAPSADGPRVLRRLLRGLWRATDRLAPGAYFVAMDDPGAPTRRSGVARLLSGRGRGPRFEVAGRQRIFLLPNPLPAPRQARWPRFGGARAAVPDGRVAVRSLAGVKDLLLLPTEQPLALAHLSVAARSPEGFVAGIQRGMRIAADAGAGHVCWALDARATATIRMLADRGWRTEAGATTYCHAPAGARWAELQVRSDQI